MNRPQARSAPDSLPIVQQAVWSPGDAEWKQSGYAHGSADACDDSSPPHAVQSSPVLTDAAVSLTSDHWSRMDRTSHHLGLSVVTHAMTARFRLSPRRMVALTIWQNQRRPPRRLPGSGTGTAKSCAGGQAPALAAGPVGKDRGQIQP